MASSVKVLTGPALVKHEAKAKSKPNEAKAKNKPSKALPFDRVTFVKQLEILRAYAAASAQGTKVVLNSDVSSIVGMAQVTISACNAFFNSIGLIQKTDAGWTVSAEVQSFFLACDWNKDTAGHQIAPLMQTAWFGQELLPKLSFREMEEEDAISQLAHKATAGSEYRRSLRMLIDYLEVTGLIQREGSLLKLRNRTSTTSEPTTNRRNEPNGSDAQSEIAPKLKVATNFTQLAQGAMRFNVSFDIDMVEMANWRPDRIAAFFNGVAQVLAAKAEVEKTAGSST